MAAEEAGRESRQWKKSSAGAAARPWPEAGGWGLWMCPAPGKLTVLGAFSRGGERVQAEPARRVLISLGGNKGPLVRRRLQPG